MRYLRAIIAAAFFCHLPLYGVVKVDDKVKKLVRDNNTFALQLFQNLSVDKGNLCISPYSISSSLAMVYTGAAGATKKQMGDVLNFAKAGDTLNQSFLWINEFLTKHTSDMPRDFRFYLANSLWLQIGLPINPTFENEMTTYYGTSLRKVDFVKHADQARFKINDWIKQKTMGRVVDMLGSDDINKATRMILASSIYMKARWDRPFNSKATEPQPFFLSNNETIAAQTMTGTGHYPYKDETTFSILELPYIHPKDSSPSLAMLIFLPKGDFDTLSLSRVITADRFATWIATMKPENLLIFIPKFENDIKINLNTVLTKMGIANAFTDSADFSGITDAKKLKIGQALHKTYISVDEGGTEAAAATAITMGLTAIRSDKEPILFQVNRPFIYIIYEKNTSAILFMGRLDNPKAKQE